MKEQETRLEMRMDKKKIVKNGNEEEEKEVKKKIKLMKKWEYFLTPKKIQKILKDWKNVGQVN